MTMRWTLTLGFASRLDAILQATLDATQSVARHGNLRLMPTVFHVIAMAGHASNALLRKSPRDHTAAGSA
jgi:hypothetical protein